VVLEEVTHTNLENLDSSVLRLLRTYCPKLNDAQFCDHTVTIKGVLHRVNRALTAPHFPLHASDEISVVDVPYSARLFKLYVQLLQKRLSLQEFEKALADLEFPDLLKLLLDMKTKGSTLGQDAVQRAFEKTINTKEIHRDSDTYTLTGQNEFIFHAPLCRVLTDRALTQMFSGFTASSNHTVTFPKDVKLQLTAQSFLFLVKNLNIPIRNA
jgi:hypothetical protein